MGRTYKQNDRNRQRWKKNKDSRNKKYEVDSYVQPQVRINYPELYKEKDK
jgi:hypothetical protein